LLRQAYALALTDYYASHTVANPIIGSHIVAKQTFFILKKTVTFKG